MIEIRIPKFDVNDNSVTIVEIFVENGQYVHKEDILVRAESTKMVRNIVSECEGYIRLAVDCFDIKNNGDVIAYIYDSKEEYDNGLIQDNTGIESEMKIQINATAKAIALAKKLNVDINKLASQKNGDIIKTSDVEKYVKTKKRSDGIADFKESVPTVISNFDRERVMIIGAGRLSEQVVDILLDDKNKMIVGLVDSYKTEYKSYCFPLYNCDLLQFVDKIDKSLYDTVIIALGGDKNTMMFRTKLYELYKANGIKFTNAIGDNTNIRRAVRIGENNIIMHNCFIGTGSQIGNNNIVSYGTCIGHHCVIGSNNLLAPSFITPGSVRIGDDNIIMTNVSTINYVTIGNGVVLPVGYKVMEDIKDGTNLLK